MNNKNNNNNDNNDDEKIKDQKEEEEEEEDEDVLDVYKTNPELLNPKPKSLFSYNWSSGFVSPFVESKIDQVLKCFELYFPKERKIERKNELIVDFGCGSANVLMSICEKFGCRGIGVDIDEQLLKKAQEEANSRQINIKFEKHDFKTMNINDFVDTTVAYVYILPVGLELLVDKLYQLLTELNNSLIIISNTWPIPFPTNNPRLKTIHTENGFYIYTFE